MKSTHESAERHNGSDKEHAGMMNGHYLRFLLMTVLMFISMYVFMYAMVDAFGNVFNSFNQFYMAGLMTAPMVLIEILLMSSMYKNKRLNLAIVLVSVIALAGFWLLIRDQTAIGDKQFLRSMIPHHAGAILMCNEASITDNEIKALCGQILSSQDREIEQMKNILDRLDK